MSQRLHTTRAARDQLVALGHVLPQLGIRPLACPAHAEAYLRAAAAGAALVSADRPDDLLPFACAGAFDGLYLLAGEPRGRNKPGLPIVAVALAPDYAPADIAQAGGWAAGPVYVTQAACTDLLRLDPPRFRAAHPDGADEGDALRWLIASSWTMASGGDRSPAGFVKRRVGQPFDRLRLVLAPEPHEAAGVPVLVRVMR